MSDWPTPEAYWRLNKWPFIHCVSMVIILGTLAYLHWVPVNQGLQFLVLLGINIVVGLFTGYQHFKKS